jgi:phospholipid/cholesterol/gamma-HCH transport system substrate-binding protein
MINRAQKTRLGIFITIGSILIIVFIILVAGSKLIERKDIYYIQFDDVSVTGLQEGGSVQYHGIKIGRVDNIRINPSDVSKVIVNVSVDAGTPIKDDVRAVLIFVGITGVKAVELTGGSNQAKLIKPGSYIPAGTSTLDTISGKAESIVEKIDLIAANLAKMTDEENQKNLSEILRQTNLILTDTRENLSGALSSLDAIAKNVSSIADSTSSGISRLTNSTNLLVLDTRSQINNIGKNTDQLILQAGKDLSLITASINSSLNRINQIVNTAEFDSLIINANTISGKLASADLKQLVTDLNTTIIQTNSLIGNLDRTVTRGKTDFLETLEALREAAENLNEFTRQIAENPSSLIIGK